MAHKVVTAESDQEMLSQTETEDTDTGEVLSENVTGQSSSSSSPTEYSLTSSSSEGLNDESFDEQRVRKLTNVSVDFTDVTALEDNASQGGESSSNDAYQREEQCTNNTKTRTNNVSKKKFGLSSLDFGSDWYNQDCFKAYWKHYDEVMAWCGKHFKVCEKLRKKSGEAPSSVGGHSVPSFGYFSYPFQPTNSWCHVPWSHPYMFYHPGTNTYSNMRKNSSGNSSQKKSSRRKTKAKYRKTKTESSSEVTSCETQTDTSEVLEMEITQDMIDFFAKTQAHRKERDEARKAEKEDEATEQEHINVEDVKVTDKRTPTVEAPKERPGAKRTAEMKLLYGKGAAMVHGMETALQMTYDRNVDLKQPKTWPNMPLRVVFS